MVDVAKLTVVVDADTASAERGLSSLDTKVSGLGSTIAGAFTGVAVAGLAGVAAGFATSVEAAAGFEKTMSAVKAVSGATAEEMSSLSDLALQLGKDTSFSASEAGKGIEELVKGGLSIPDIMNGAAKSMLDLAAAGSVSLPDAATIAANALAQFNLKGEDMAHVADLIAGAANASALDVSDFKFSLQSAGAVASTVGFSFDDLAQAIAVMGKAGITGSDAGTSLKTMMLNLQPSTNAQKDLFRQLGLTTSNLEEGLRGLARMGIQPLTEDWPGLNRAIADHLGLSQSTAEWSNKDAQAFDNLSRQVGATGSAFFDSSGKVKSMAEVAGVLQNALSGMNEAQRLATLETMFGSDAIRAGAILAKEGAEGFNTMAEAMGKVSAESVGATKLDNLAGSFEQLKGSAETLAITFGMHMLPALKDVTDGATGIINRLIPLANEWGPKVADAMRELGQTFRETFAGIGEWFRENGPLIEQTLKSIAGENANLEESFRSTWGLIKSQVGADLANIGDTIRLGLQVINGDWQGAWDTLLRIGEREQKAQRDQFEAHGRMWTVILDNWTGGAATKFDTWTKDVGRNLSNAWADIRTDTQTAWSGAAGIAETIGGALNTIQTTTDTVSRATKNVIEAVWGEIHDQVIKPKTDAIASLVEAAWTSVKTRTSELLDPVLTYVRDTIFEPIRAAIADKIALARDAFGSAIDAIKSKAEGILNPLLSWWRDTIWGPMQATAEGASTASSSTFVTAINSIKTAVDTTLGGIKSVWETTWGAIQRAAESPKAAMDELIKLVNTLKGIMPEWLIPHSPTPFQVGLEGIMVAARDMNGQLERFFGGTAGGMGDVSNWLRAAISAAGVGEDWLAGLVRLVSWESSGNPTAVNPTSVGGEHATGLMQTLPSTFRANALPGMGDILNPIHNAAAAIKYIKATYGSVYNIPGIRSGNHAEFPGYGEGGIAWTPHLAYVAERGPEAIIPLSRMATGGGTIYVDMRGSQVYDGQGFADLLVRTLESAERGGRIVKVTR